MLVNHDIPCGTRITVTIHLCETENGPDSPKLAANGVVVRTEPQQAGVCGVAVKFHHYRFI